MPGPHGPTPEPRPEPAPQPEPQPRPDGPDVPSAWQSSADAVRLSLGMASILQSGEYMAQVFTTTIGNPDPAVGTFWGWGVLRFETQNAWQTAANAVVALQQ